MINSVPKDPAAAARQERLAHEAALLEEGRADIGAGRYLSGEALATWLDGLTQASLNRDGTCL